MHLSLYNIKSIFSFKIKFFSINIYNFLFTLAILMTFFTFIYLIDFTWFDIRSVFSDFMLKLAFVFIVNIVLLVYSLLLLIPSFVYDYV